MPPSPGVSRRLVVRLGLGAVGLIAVAGVGAELVEHGVMPGKSELDALDGACDVPVTDFATYAAPGPEISGTFYSAARRRDVGYTIGYPPGHRAGSALPLVVMLHGEGGNHTDALVGLSPAQAVALRAVGAPLAPMALVTVDGGAGYWNAHPGDDPMGMLTDELIPMCQRRGLGRPPHRIGAMGISMGGYGALLLAEKRPRLISAVAAISPAIWTSYAQARSVNAGAYASAADFAADDAVTHASALSGKPVRIASGDDDPFRPGVQALASALAGSSGSLGSSASSGSSAGAGSAASAGDVVVEFAKGCHDGSFFAEQEPPSLSFLASHITSG
jgi:S-formylglutathione hydrolase FrmB